MKSRDSNTLPISCPSCERTVYIAVARLGVVCTGCRKTIPVTPKFLAAIRGQ